MLGFSALQPKAGIGILLLLAIILSNIRDVLSRPIKPSDFPKEYYFV
jgi:hypothetical protein